MLHLFWLVLLFSMSWLVWGSARFTPMLPPSLSPGWSAWPVSLGMVDIRVGTIIGISWKLTHLATALGIVRGCLTISAWSGLVLLVSMLRLGWGSARLSPLLHPSGLFLLFSTFWLGWGSARLSPMLHPSGLFLLFSTTFWLCWGSAWLSNWLHLSWLGLLFSIS